MVIKRKNEHVKILIIFFEKILLLKIERVIFWAYKISSSVKACNNQINVKQIQRQINKLFRFNSEKERKKQFLVLVLSFIMENNANILSFVFFFPYQMSMLTFALKIETIFSRKMSHHCSSNELENIKKETRR